MNKLALLNAVAKTILLLVCCATAQQGPPLKKPYTLRIPMLSPVTGAVQPLGVVCTAALEMVANAANSQSKILPDYNIIFDFYDDKCTDYVGVERLMTFYARSLPNPVSLITEVHGNFMIPVDAAEKIGNKNATTFLPPMLVNSVCSGVCKVTSRFMQEFNVIAGAYGCNEPSIDRQKPIYRNLFRFLPSLVKYATARVNFAVSMKWQKVAIVTDSLLYSLMDTSNLMKQLQAVNIKIIAEEFYVDDPTEAVQRLKQSGARIIFANCYVSTCPYLACSGHREGLYGPKIVWVFKPDVNVAGTQLKRQSWCSETMLLTFAERTIYSGADLVGDAFANSTNELGISYAGFRERMLQQQPDIQYQNPYSWRTVCIEPAHAAVNILDSVEKRLNSVYNSSIKDYYLGDVKLVAKLPPLVQLVRQSARNIDVRSLTGRHVLEKDDSDSEPIFPIMVVNQVQNGVRQLAISFERSYNEKDRQLRPPGGGYNVTTVLVHRAIIWGTKDGKPPLSHPVVSHVYLHVHFALIGVVWCACCFVILASLATLGVQIQLRNYSEVSNTYPLLCNFVLVGIIGFISCTFFFPLTHNISAMNTFCNVAPFLALISFTLVTSPIICKVLIVYLQDEVEMSERRSNLVTKCVYVVWLLVNLVVLIIWYTGSRPFAWVKVVNVPSNDDVDLYEHWVQCSLGDDFTYIGIILGMQALFLVAGIVVSLLTSKKRKLPAEIKRVQNIKGTSDLRHSQVCLYITLPSLIAALMVFLVQVNMNIEFGLVALFCLATCCSILTILFCTKRGIYLRGWKGGNVDEEPNHAPTPPGFTLMEFKTVRASRRPSLQ